jgi:trigger factor
LRIEQTEPNIEHAQTFRNNPCAILIVTINRQIEDESVGGKVKVSVEKLPSSEAVLEIDISWDEMEKASDKAYRKLVKSVDIQGFRRGKAPRSILERRVGKEYIYQEGLDELISEAYSSAIKEHDLTPITQPKLDAPIFEIGKPYHFSLTVPVITPVELGDYKSLEFEREEVSVTSEEVDKELESLRQRVSDWEAVERPVEYGDRIKADLKLVSDEKQISDLKDNLFEITNERHGLFTGMDEHLVGMSAGESKTFTTTIPADYSNEKLAGKEANYEVSVHSVEVKNIPELDDAFAAKVSDGQFETLEDLSKVLSDNILENKKRQNNDALRDKVINAVIEQSTFVVHPLLIEEEAEEIAHQMGHSLQQQHLNLDQYLKMVGKTREEYLQEVQPEAEKRVKRQLVLSEIAQREEITVQPDEIEALFNAYEQIGQPLPREEEQIRALALSYRREKTISRLVELAAGPDPDEAEASIVGAEAAAQAGEDEVAEIVEAAVAAEAGAGETSETTTVETEASATATPQSEESRTEPTE